jgi:DNA-binding PadR family transcriptional regulator
MAQTATRLLVLGTVRGAGPVHGYEVRRKLLSWAVDQWANTAPGSIYNALRTLTREGLLEVAGTDRQGARPERTTYQLTAEGEKEFQRLLRYHVWESVQPNHPLLVGLAFFEFLPQDEFVRALRHRIEELEGRIAAFRKKLDLIAGQGDPRGGAAPYAMSIRLVIALQEAEAGWTRDFAARVDSGEFDGVWDTSRMTALG